MMKAAAGGGASRGSGHAAAFLQLATCGICMEPFEEVGEHVPLLFQCGHTWCSSCAHQLAAPKKCPTCRRPLGFTQVASLPQNFTLLEILAEQTKPPLHGFTRYASSMSDEELEAFMRERREKKDNNSQALLEELVAQKVVLERERSIAARALTTQNSQIEAIKLSCAQTQQALADFEKSINEYMQRMLALYEKQLQLDSVVRLAELNSNIENSIAQQEVLQAQAEAKQKQEQDLALQLTSLQAQIAEAEEAACSAARAAATYAVRLSGATGDNAAYINGLYEVTDEVSGGMPVYKKQGGDMWLEYHVSNRMWLSRSTVDKGQTSRIGYACVTCDIGVLPDNAPTGSWRVFDGVASTTQASVVVSPLSVAEAAAEAAAHQAACAAARAAATYAVRISGATGNFASAVNGLYEVTDEVSGDMPVYKKRGENRQLHYIASERRWATCRITIKDKASDLRTAFVDCAIGVLPDNASRGAWRVKVNGAWVAQASVLVTPMSAAEMAALQAAEQAAAEAEAKAIAKVVEEVAAVAEAVQAACAAARAAAMYAVRISGATGDNAARVNGLYEVTDEVFGGMPVYKKQGAKRWLEYHVPFSTWMSRSTKDKGKEYNVACTAYVDCDIGLLPDNAQTGDWYVLVNGAFEAQASIVVSPVMWYQSYKYKY